MKLFLTFYLPSTSWYSQPYTGGSYTAIGKGGSQADIEKIAEPLYVREKKTNKVREIRSPHEWYY